MALPLMNLSDLVTLKDAIGFQVFSQPWHSNSPRQFINSEGLTITLASIRQDLRLPSAFKKYI